MKKLGVIGGMGPEATSLYYAKVIEWTNATRDQEHIDMVILSHASMPDRTEAILTGQTSAFLQAIKEDVEALEQMGVANIAVPCNTSHSFLREIQNMTRVPVIDMVKEGVRCIQGRHPDVRKVGILATDGTIRSGLYQHACTEAGIEAAVPDTQAQRAVMSLIYDDIKGGRYIEDGKFYQAYRSLMAQGCGAALLACTELSIYKECSSVPENCIDAMDALVQESILRSGAQLREGGGRLDRRRPKGAPQYVCFTQEGLVRRAE